MKRTFRFAILLLALLGFVSYPLIMCAQVTIGSTGTPLHGTLLQLKEDEGSTNNSNRGLGLPRVKLTNLTPATPAALAASMNGSGSYDLDLHVGLVVYNTNKCAPFGMGLYVWNGTAWQGINAAKPLSPPSLDVTHTILYIPSGMDNRAMSTQTLSFNWANNNTATWSNLTNNIGGGLVFTNFATQMAPATKSWTTSPAILSVQPDAMTSALVTAANPWQTRESKTTITVPTNECGGAAMNRTITLNQTNYAILSYNDGIVLAGSDNNTLTTASNGTRLTDNSSRKFYIRSNTVWKSTVTGNPAILNHNIPATGGADIINGSTPPLGTEYFLQGVAGTNTKYQTATITIEDRVVPKRANNITVACYLCIGTHANWSWAGLRTVAPAETSANTNTWGTSVILHEAKSGVYDEFLSADFGVAGRWMTTNLSAIDYDGVTHGGGRLLTGPNGNSYNGVYNTTYWAYPNVNGLYKPTNPVEYNKDKSVGLLYTWDAASAGKGGSTGTLNIYNTSGGTAPNNEKAMPEGTAAGQQRRIQGICPKGWHLPSEYEWTELQREIIRNTTKYAHVSNNIDNGDGMALAEIEHTPIASGDTAWKGTHAPVMKERCSPDLAPDPRGKSKTAIEGGFAILLAGNTSTNTSYNFGVMANLWTSSSHYLGNPDHGYALSMHLTFSDERFGTFVSARKEMYSVRCKKD